MESRGLYFKEKMTKKDYKKTLNLPQTEFPMKADLTRREPDILKFWDAKDIYSLSIQTDEDKPFILHDGPPYANGDIHLGHTLNKVLKDIVVKYKSMRGFWAPFVPGWDCHGQPIDHEVEKLLKGRKVEATVFRKKCREYALKYVKRQADQFRRLGIRGNYQRPYLTLDYDYEATVIRTFATLYKNGLIYQGLKPVHWCYTDKTALAEAEIEYADHETPSIYVRFPLKDKIKSLETFEETKSMVIWTTTPWTLPANVAVAVHPDEEYSAVKAGEEILIMASRLVPVVAEDAKLERYEVIKAFQGKNLKGLKLAHPLMKWDSVVVTAQYVTLEQGTGCVHIAPGHGQEDYQVGLEHSLPTPMPVDDDGIFTAEAGKWAGRHVMEANSAIVEDLSKRGFLLSSGTILHSYPHCWRCKNPVVFRATRQWFVSMEKAGLRKKALEAIGEVKWIPPTGEHRIRAMVEERPDWCISRQRVWGVPLPIFYCVSCDEPLINEATLKAVEDIFAKEGSDAWFLRKSAEILPAGQVCSKCGGKEFRKGKDILDVWFESGTSHAAVLKAREDQRWPADLYLEGSDQHRGWFQLSLLVSVGIGDRAPYKAVLTHGFLVDGQGRKMSKSLGNVIDPLDVIEESGADILRLWVASGDYSSPDVAISTEILERVAEAYRRIRNTVRFLLGNLSDFDFNSEGVSYEQMEEIDKWALLRLHKLIDKVTRDYNRHLFHLVVRHIHNFCVVDMSTFYLDVLKDRLYTAGANSRARRSAQTVLREILLSLVRMIAPILSFTAEEVWQFLPGSSDRAVSVELAGWPETNKRYLDKALEEKWDRLIKVRDGALKALEEARASKLIGTSLEAKVEVYTSGKLYDFLVDNRELLPTLFIVSQVEVSEKPKVDLAIKVAKASGEKCERCWNFSQRVGKDREHPALCPRCLKVIKGTG